MSLTPIFDAVLADSDPDIFLAGNVFPTPARPVIESLGEALRRIGHPAVTQEFGPPPKPVARFFLDHSRRPFDW